MKTATAISKISVLALLAVCLCAAGLRAQARQTLLDGKGSGEQQSTRSQLLAPRERRTRLDTYRSYLASEEGRAMMQAAGRPVSKYLNDKYGAPSPEAVERARVLLQKMAAQAQPVEAAPAKGSVPCNTSTGARFNLEPRPNAEPQNEPVTDFILNGAGTGDDLIVQAANDWRGEYPNPKWNDSISGYYVHTSKTADCSVQFEGGLPDIGETSGEGFEWVAADPVRGAFFMADTRFPNGVGLFRASTAALLNPKICAPGTHLEAQSESCWGQTPPVLITAGTPPEIDQLNNLVVDQRPTGSGPGAGDVYLLIWDAYANIVACTNTLAQCSSPLNIGGLQINGPNINSPASYVQVRPDGVITISYEVQQNPNEPISFITCTPAGAPNPPVCQPPSAVATVAHPIPSATFPNQFLQNIDILDMFTYPKHVNRHESNGTFTTFMVYDDCKNPYTQPPPPSPQSLFCLSAEVNMTYSQDGGQTWSTPVSVNVVNAHQFYPSITNDESTGTVSIAWYSTEGDPFFNTIRVFMAQIPPGSTTLGPVQPVTSFTQIDPDGVAYILDDVNMGAIAHGTGTAGQSHLYLSFDSSAVDGTYNKEPLPDLNNHIMLITY
jgi:hypothetical protein